MNETYPIIRGSELEQMLRREIWVGCGQLEKDDWLAFIQNCDNCLVIDTRKWIISRYFQVITDWVNSLGYLWDFRVFMVNDWVCILQYFRFRVTYLKNHYFTITKAARLPSFLLNF